MSDCCSKPSPSENSCCDSPKKRPDWLLRVTLTAVLVLYLIALAVGESLSTEGLVWLSVMASAIFELMNTIWWGLMLAALFVGLLDHIPQQWVSKVLGRGDSFGGILRATCAGVLLDLCSHGILMVGMKLYQRGASLGQVMAFLIASPWNSLSLTLILWALIGWQWTLAFVFLSMLVGIVAGLLINVLERSEYLPANPFVNGGDEEPSLSVVEAWCGIRWRWSLVPEIFWQGLKGSRMVLRWVFLGLLIAAVIRAFVPLELFQNLFGATAMGLGMTLLAATVIEVCSEGSTPIAADIFHRAAAPGNSFAFLMTGVSTDYTEIMSLKDTTRSWWAALALPLVTLPQIVIIAWLLNQAV